MNKYQEAIDVIARYISDCKLGLKRYSDREIGNALAKIVDLEKYYGEIEEENKELREQVARYKRMNPNDLSWTINPCSGCKDYCYKNDSCKSNGGCLREEELIKTINITELDPTKKYLVQVGLPGGYSIEGLELLEKLKRRLDSQGLETTIYVGDIKVKEV